MDGFSRFFPSIIGGLCSIINIYQIGCFYLRNNYSRCFQTIIVGLYLRINIYQIGCFYIFYIFMFDFSINNWRIIFKLTFIEGMIFPDLSFHNVLQWHWKKIDTSHFSKLSSSQCTLHFSKLSSSQCTVTP